jgi:hypothetical protein
MDLLENQVNDLKYLSQSTITPLAETPGFTPQSAASPVSAVGHNSALQQQPPYQQQQHHHNNRSASALEDQTAGTKRKSDDQSPSAGKQQRSKRNRYISIAW